MNFSVRWHASHLKVRKSNPSADGLMLVSIIRSPQVGHEPPLIPSRVMYEVGMVPFTSQAVRTDDGALPNMLSRCRSRWSIVLTFKRKEMRSRPALGWNHYPAMRLLMHDRMPIALGIR